MNAVFQSFLQGLPVLLQHFGITVAMFAVGLFIYTAITPHKEFSLVKGGNTAAAISFASAALGLGIPLAVCMANSVSNWDIVIWGVLTIVIQLAAFFVVNLLLKGLPKRIEDGEVPAAIVLMGIKLSIAAINAAAVSG